MVTKSRYDGSKITTKDKVRDANLLRYWLDKRKLDECREAYNKNVQERDELMKKRTDLDKKLMELNRDWQEDSAKMKDLKSKHSEKERLAAMIEFKREKLERIRKDQIDLNIERQKLQEKIEQHNLKSLNFLKKLTKHNTDYASARESQMENIIVVKIAEANLKIARKRYENSKQNTSKLSEEIKNFESDLARLEEELKNRLKLGIEKINGFSRSGKLSEEAENAFSTVDAATIDELENKKAELEFSISRIYRDKDNTVLDQYKKERAELAQKQAKITELECEHTEKSESRAEIKKRWLPELQKVIAVINKDYTEFMRKLSYGGEVHLDFDSANPDDFSQYGIRIMVKYRDDEALIPLSSTRQSGGERSVAIMIYMLALQNKTSVPFRCVDEINQGMDKDNERKVFELLVKTADSSSSQYFLVSPKLLTNLPYSAKMKIHVVFNGPRCSLNWNQL